MIEKYVDAEELKRLLSGLVAVLCALVIAGLFASIVVPGLRNANKPSIQTTALPSTGQTGWLDPTEYPPTRGRIIPPVDPKTLIEPSAALKAHGKELFENNCIQCHGPLGRGDGPAAGTMNPHPRNFTSPDGWTNGYDLAGIYKTLSFGVKDTSMSSFDYLSREDRMALAQYVQSLGAFPHDTATPQAMDALSKELAAPGEKTPNKIPVSMAMSKLEEEFIAPLPISAGSEDRSIGANLLRRVIVNPSRAAQTLTGSQLWRSGARDLAASILPDTPVNGFSVKIASLTPDEWQALYAELLKRIKSK
jgi:mono/diheme cytochrome c family protein